MTRCQMILKVKKSKIYSTQGMRARHRSRASFTPINLDAIQNCVLDILKQDDGEDGNEKIDG